MSRHEDAFQRTLVHNTVERRQQVGYLLFAPVQPFRNRQPTGDITLSRRKQINASPRFQIEEATLEVSLDAGGGLITILRGFGEEFENDCRELFGNVLSSARTGGKF